MKMENKFISLKLVLDVLMKDSDFDDINSRKMVQKIIYLCQRIGVDFNYQYRWYSMRVYCPNLADDYYLMYDAIEAKKESLENKVLKKSVMQHLNKLYTILEPPDKVNLNQVQWLELLTSVDFQKKIRQRSKEEAKQLISEEKPELSSYFDDALLALQNIGIQ